MDEHSVERGAGPGGERAELRIGPAGDGDLPEVLDLLRASMGRSDDPRFVDLFRWKHLDNAFGASPAWIARDGDRLAAVRYLMRWEFDRPGGGVARAVRAVDTATHPDYQGRGLFKKLTLGAISVLREQGVDFVFNTPNDQSRPGYLKMGWQEVGKWPIHMRPLGLSAPLKILRARVPAGHFSMPTDVGVAAADALADSEAVQRLLDARPAATRLRTRASVEYLRWRYASELLPYRAVVQGEDGASPDAGLALFRLRQRGPAVETALALVLAPNERVRRRLVGEVGRVTRRVADYVVALGDRPRADYLPMFGQGPVMTWRAIDGPDTPSDTPSRQPAEMPALDEWQFTLGDIELF